MTSSMTENFIAHGIRLHNGHCTHTPIFISDRRTPSIATDINWKVAFQAWRYDDMHALFGYALDIYDVLKSPVTFLKSTPMKRSL